MLRQKQYGIRWLGAILCVVLTESSALAFKGETDKSVVQSTAVKSLQKQPSVKRSASQIEAAEAAVQDGVRVTWHPKRSTPSSVRGSNLGLRKTYSGGKGIQLKGGRAYQEDAVAVLDNLSPIFRIKDATNEFKVRKSATDVMGFQHVRMKQTHLGLRVVGGELIVHFDKKGTAYEVNGQYVSDITASATPMIDSAEVVRIAQAELMRKGLPQGTVVSEPELVIYARDTEPCLAYELTLTYDDSQAGPGRWRFWIDGLQGKVLFYYNNIQYIAQPTNNGTNTTITGSILAGEGGGTTNVMGWYENTGNTYLYNTTRHWYVYNVAASGWTDANTYAYRSGNAWGTSDRAEMSLARNFDLVQKYYRDVHGLNSFDGVGTWAQANAHEGINYVNAYWDGTDFHFGDGNGAQANSLAVLDIAGHEYGHAVTAHSANLIYSYESGALNESFSDIFGTCIEFASQPDGRMYYPGKVAGTADWLCGEDSWITGALRDLRNPQRLGQPSLYKGAYWYNGAGDNGGVHYNSGVQNFFFYLLCEGGIGNNDGVNYNVTGIGITNAEKVAFLTLTKYCTPDTDYDAVRQAWISAANQLNPAWVPSVQRAWNAVFYMSPPVIYSPSTLPAGRVGTPYAYTIVATGGAEPYTWQWIEGSLPALLTFTNAVISGMPEVAGTNIFKVAVFDDQGQSATNEFSLTILPAFDLPYKEDFEDSGNSPDSWYQEYVSGSLSWTFRSGTPNGGIPVGAYAGGYNACLAAEAYGLVTRLISPRLDCGVGLPSVQLTFWHCMAGWSVDQDELRVYYKAVATDGWTLMATFTDSIGSWTMQTLTLPNPTRTSYIAFEGNANYGHGVCIDNVEVKDPRIPLSIATASLLPAATRGLFYEQTLTVIGGTTNYTYDLVSGGLPGGITFSNGVISGTASVVTTTNFTIRVTDAVSATATKEFFLTVELPRAILFTEDFEYDSFLPPDWSQEGATNTIISWKAERGGMDGHPSSSVSSNYNALLWGVVVDKNGIPIDQKNKLISPEINLGQAPANTRLTFWHCMQGWDGEQDELRVYSRTSATNAWNLLATFTNSVDSWTMQTLTLPNPSSTYYIAFEGNAKHGYGVCIDDVLISDAADAPIITTRALLPYGEINVPYSQLLTAVGGEKVYTWSVVSNAFAGTGLTLGSADGLISGTPVVGGTFNFKVQVMGSDSKASTNSFSLLILKPFPIPYFEPFENGGLMPIGWMQNNLSGSANWAFIKGSSSGTPPAAYANDYNACLYFGERSVNKNMLVSPMLDLSACSTNALLTFWHSMQKFTVDQDELRVYSRTSASNEWVLLETYTSNVPGWIQQTVVLPNPSGTYSIGFEGIAQYGYGVCVDDVRVTSGLSAYEQWRVNMFGTNAVNVAIAGDNADPDGDLIVNWLEYAYGMNPNTNSVVGLPTGGVVDGYLTWNYREGKAATNVVFYVIEACTNLTNQVWSTANVVEFSRADSNDWWQVLTRHTEPVTNAPQRFLRLKISMP